MVVLALHYNKNKMRFYWKYLRPAFIYDIPCNFPLEPLSSLYFGVLLCRLLHIVVHLWVSSVLRPDFVFCLLNRCSLRACRCYTTLLVQTGCFIINMHQLLLIQRLMTPINQLSLIFLLMVILFLWLQTLYNFK